MINNQNSVRQDCEKEPPNAQAHVQFIQETALLQSQHLEQLKVEVNQVKSDLEAAQMQTSKQNDSLMASFGPKLDLFKKTIAEDIQLQLQNNESNQQSLTGMKKDDLDMQKLILYNFEKLKAFAAELE